MKICISTIPNSPYRINEKEGYNISTYAWLTNNYHVNFQNNGSDHAAIWNYMRKVKLD